MNSRRLFRRAELGIRPHGLPLEPGPRPGRRRQRRGSGHPLQWHLRAADAAARRRRALVCPTGLAYLQQVACAGRPDPHQGGNRESAFGLTAAAQRLDRRQTLFAPLRDLLRLRHDKLRGRPPHEPPTAARCTVDFGRIASKAPTAGTARKQSYSATSTPTGTTSSGTPWRGTSRGPS